MSLWVLGLSASQRDVLGINISVALATVNVVQFSDRKKHHGKSEGDGERAGGGRCVEQQPDGDVSRCQHTEQLEM